MTTLREAATLALEFLDDLGRGKLGDRRETVEALRTALNTQSTHSDDCYRWHHECAIAKIERAAGSIKPASDYTPLTDEQMRECAQAMDAEPLSEGWSELIKFARDIEAEVLRRMK